MVRTSFSGQEIASVLTSHGYHPVDRTGSHLKLRYEHPDTGEIRVVTVPMKSADRIPTGTLQSTPTSAERKTSTRGVGGSMRTAEPAAMTTDALILESVTSIPAAIGLRRES
jgi:predicted RNA binding protein YcfA (HicA-like mRNA interferase family)